jgi:hypothetical protein
MTLMVSDNPVGSNSIKSRGSLTADSTLELSASTLAGPDPSGSMAALNVWSKKSPRLQKVKTQSNETKLPPLDPAPFPLSYERKIIGLCVLCFEG